MTHDNTIKLLALHSFKPTDQTEVDCSVRPRKLIEKGSSFYERFGIRKNYVKRDVLQWLGY